MGRAEITTGGLKQQGGRRTTGAIRIAKVEGNRSFQEFDNKFGGIRGPARNSGRRCSCQGCSIKGQKRPNLPVDTIAVEREIRPKGIIRSLENLRNNGLLPFNMGPRQDKQLHPIRQARNSVPVVGHNVVD